MAEPFLGEIRMVSFGFPPKGWAWCNGQLLPINQNQALFSLLGTTYGGDGRVNFALPNMQGRSPIHRGSSHLQGEQGGEIAHTLTNNEIPSHSHALMAGNSNNGNVSDPRSAYLSNSAPAQTYSNQTSQLVALSPSTVGTTGGSQPHSNLQPYLVLGFCIALQGIFPSPT